MNKKQFADARRELLQHLLAEEGLEESGKILPRDQENELPLSFSQERLWFLEQLTPGDLLYNCSQSLLITGSLDVAALERALNEVVRRHEALRTTFPTIDERPVQQIAPFVYLPLPVLDISELPRADREQSRQELSNSESQRPFDLASGPLVRAVLVKLGEQEHALLLTLHHIISDGWSISVLCREISTLYEAFSAGQPSPLAELPIQYADFALWQRQHLQGEVLEEFLTYWRKQLAGIPPSLELPGDRSRPAVSSFHGGNYSFVLSKSLSQGLKTLSQREGVTLFMTLLAAFDTLLYRYTGQTDIVVGSAIANRNRAEIEPLIGFFINMLVMRLDLAGDPSFRELLGRAREVTLEGFNHQDLPLEKVIEMLQPQRRLNRAPVYQVEFTVQNAPVEPLQVRGLKIAPLNVHQESSATDFNLMMSEGEQGLAGNVIYSTDLFDHARVVRMIGHFENMLEGIVADPEQQLSQLPLMSEEEARELVAVAGNDHASRPPVQCVQQLFEEQAERSPHSVAAVYGDRQLSYHELNRRANQLAHYLRRQGVRPETLVGIYLDRSFEMLVALLGVLKAGGAFVPLDPSYPREAVAFMLDDAEVSLLLTRESLTGKLPQHGATVICVDTSAVEIEREREENPSTLPTSENLAYVIYTSGSTGRPNGVLVEHRPLVEYCLAFIKRLELRSTDRILQFASLSFDVALEEIFPTLSCGAAVVLREESLPPSSAELLQEIEARQITALELPTAYWHGWVRELSSLATQLPASLRFVIIGGEKISLGLLAAWKKFAVPLVHVYGVTEATITSTIYELPAGEGLQDGEDLPIGQALANTQLYLLDSNLRPVPTGVSSEVYLAGDCLARGYLRRPALTAERFVPDPFSVNPGARMYKTGDLAYRQPDGNVLFLGRVDQQVKIRGYRVEPGGVETLLKQHPAIQDAAVIVSAAGNGHSHLFKTGANGAVVLADTRLLADKLASLGVEEVEQLFAKAEALAEGEVETILASDLQLTRDSELTKIRRFPQFDVTLKLKDEQFINPPQQAQKNWLIRRALDEFADDLRHLDVLSRRFVAGSARPRLAPQADWDKSHARYDSDHQLIIAGQQVMQDWEAPLMEAMAKVVTETHGDVLELGFGMGISATYIQKFGVRSYTIVEYNDEVVKRFHEWKRQFNGRDIRLIHGRWHDVTDQLATYDGIFFDTVPTFEDEYLREVIDNVVMAEDFFPIAARCLRPGGIFTWYTNEIDTLSRRHQGLIQQYFSSFTVSVVRPLFPPEDSHYWFADSMVVVKAVK